MIAESTRALIVGLFVLTGREELLAREIIALARPAGATSTNVKSHLTRLVAQGVLTRRGPNRASLYRPSKSRGRVIDSIRRRISGSTDRWDGRWILLAVQMPREHDARARLQRRLHFDGFRRWSPGLFVRPAWPGVEAIAATIARRGYGDLVMAGAPLRGLEQRAVEKIFDLDRLDRRASTLAAHIDRKLRSIRTPERAFAERVACGERVARLMADDPRLPPELLGGRHGVRDLVLAYERLERVLAHLSRAFVDGVVGTRTIAEQDRTQRSARA